MNSDPPIQPEESANGVQSGSATKVACAVLGGGAALVGLLFGGLHVIGAAWWIAIPLFVSVLITSVFSCIAYLMTVLLAFGTSRWQPATLGLLAGSLALFLAMQTHLPGPIRVVLIPLTSAALAATAMLREDDWTLLDTVTRTDRKGSIGEWFCILTVCLGGLGIGIKTGIGKPILRALGQDIVGVMQSEKSEIAVAGGIIGAGYGIIVGILLVSALWSRARTNSQT